MDWPGIRWLEPGFGRIEIAPYLPESMNEFTGSIQTPCKKEKLRCM